MAAQEILRFAGDVDIAKATIISSRGLGQNVLNQIKGIQIFEDLLSPFITGTIILKDSLDLANLFPFIGEEYLELTIKTPTLKKGNLDGKFYIYKMTDRNMMGDRSVGYQLHFINQYALIDLNKSISKTFGGKVSDIVKELFTDKTNGLQLKSTQYTIEETKNSVKYTSNFWSPVKNILYLTENAVNVDMSPSYTCFENRDGINFLSLGWLYKQPAVQEFVYDNYSRDDRNLGGSVKNLEQDYKRITKLVIPTGVDYMDRITSGIYGSRMYTHDILSKKISSKNFDMLQTYKKKPHLNEFPSASSKAIYRYGSKTMFSPKYYNNFSNFGDVTNTNYIQERISLLKQSESTKVEITVPGKWDYTVGKKVYLKLNKVEPISKKDKDTLDKLFSGNYIISAINHFVTREMHECTMELIKDSLLVNLDTGDKK
jgi:hypothetical protein